MLNYHLFHQLHSHAKEVRCVDCFKDLLVTGGSDLQMCLYTRADGKYQEVNRVNIFESYLYAVKINPFELGSYAIAVGCKDSRIFLFDAVGNPTLVLEGHTSSVCSLSWLDRDTLVSGSWDGTANIWSVSQNKVIANLKGHTHAVAVLAIGANNLVVTGSQDGNLNIWEASTGKLIKKKERAHADIIREIASVHQVGFLTCSNDETVKLWSLDGNELLCNRGHTSFVFSVKAKQLGGQYFSGGEDRTLRVWSNNNLMQTIAQPGTVWNIAVNDEGDVVVGCSDAVVRIFSQNQARRAPEEEIKALQQECIKSSAEKSGMTEQQIIKLPHVDKMPLHKGKKEGDIKVFRNGNIPEAYSWKTNHWELIGEVITNNQAKPTGAPGQRRYYHGDDVFPAGQYDYLFDVDDESGTPKVIPFNNGDNALVEAQKYCKREGLPKGYIEQIRKFLSANSSNIPTSKQDKMETESEQLESIPMTVCVEFVGISNVAGLKTKLFEFNEGVEERFKLNTTDKAHLERIVSLLENEKTYHQWTLDFKELDALKKIFHWPEKFKLPVWDILRNYLKHYQSEGLFSGLDRGMDIIGPLCQAVANPATPEPLSGLILRVLANTFLQNTSMNCMTSNADVILQTLASSSQKGFEGKSYATSLSGLMLNYSVGFLEKPIESKDALNLFLKIIEHRLSIEKDELNQHNYLVAVGNLLHKYPSTKPQAEFAKNYARGDAITRDLSRLLK